MNGPEFEAEVRSIARALWSARPGEGAPSIVDGRERDCVFHEEHLIHYVECTMLQTMEKMRQDFQKMLEFRAKATKASKLVKLWFVTLNEPTSDQRTEGQQKTIEVLSLDQFRRRIIDASDYLECRRNPAFGSATNPTDDSQDLGQVRYQPVGIRLDADGSIHNITYVRDRLLTREQLLLLADYGMGKSITIRQLFVELAKLNSNSLGASPIPVAINLRQHWGQSEPQEVLARHASLVGMSQPHHLVRAFNAGRLVILLDGFDELGAQVWSSGIKDRAKDLRRKAVALIRNFVASAKGKCGLLIAGREHYFDSRPEMHSLLGTTSSTPTLTLDEFNDQEASQYLQASGLSGLVPEWLPKRPLFLAHLVARDLLSDILSPSTVDPAQGWSRLLSLTCEREARTHELLDAQAIRTILERLASRTRKQLSGTNAVTEDDLIAEFQRAVGAFPDAPARVLLQRLPGLSARNQQDGHRVFLDDQLLDALRAGDVLRFVQDPWSDPDASNWKVGLGELGIALVRDGLTSQTSPLTNVVIASGEAVTRWGADTLSADCVQAACELAGEAAQVDFGSITIRGANIVYLDLSSRAVPNNLSFVDCTFGAVALPDQDKLGPSIVSSFVGEIIGCADEQSLPAWIHDCIVDEFDEVATNSAVVRDNSLSIGTRVLATIIRKLYFQPGSGRKMTALYRGLPPQHRKFVDDIIELLKQEGAAYSSTTRGTPMLFPVLGKRRRMRDILDHLSTSADLIAKKAKVLH